MTDKHAARELLRKVREQRGEEVPAFQPSPPTSIPETGLSTGFLADLALKFLYYEGYMTGIAIARALELPFNGVVDRVITFLKRERFCEVIGSHGPREASYQYVITDRGGNKAREVLERSHYVGPAPVPLRAYIKSVREQSIQQVFIEEEEIERAFSHLVLNEETMGQIGPAINTGRSIFLYGLPGNGKTSIAETIGKLVLKEGNIYIPYALEIDGQIIKFHDDINHQTVKTDDHDKHDARWLLIRRPVITAGGELTLASLDLIYNEVSMYYEAPFQTKANGGMLLIDDFGRQQARPQHLLNRWIVPLEKRVDFLTLHTGRKIEMPFDVLIIFSTNLPPESLVDEAFLRRIRTKIEVASPTFEEYREIFEGVCRAKGVPYDEQGLAYLLNEHYIKPGVQLRACHPRDIIDELLSIARYHKAAPQLTPALIDKAWRSYFVRVEGVLA